MGQSWKMVCVLIAVLGTLFLAQGCASRQLGPGDHSRIERPARPLSEEETFSDEVGEAGVAVLVVGITAGVILMPLILLGVI